MLYRVKQLTPGWTFAMRRRKDAVICDFYNRRKRKVATYVYDLDGRPWAGLGVPKRFQIERVG